MQLEVGSILEGKVSGITKFGAFVELPDNKTGMVHISEIAAAYVKEISDFLHLNDMVKVKIIDITPEGKISLSIKQALPPPPPQQRTFQRDNNFRGNQQGGGQSGGQGGGFRPRPGGSRGGFRPHREVQSPFEKKEANANASLTFEDMMSRFKQTSDDKMSDLKKVTDAKRGTSRGKRSKP